MSGPVRAFAAAMAVAAAVSGQPPPTWWQDKELAARLHLTPRQARELESIYQSSLAERRKHAEELSRATEELNRLLDALETTETQVLATAERLAGAQRRRNTARTVMLFRMHHVLTPRQRSAFKTLYDQWQRTRARPGDRRP